MKTNLKSESREAHETIPDIAVRMQMPMVLPRLHLVPSHAPVAGSEAQTAPKPGAPDVQQLIHEAFLVSSMSFHAFAIYTEELAEPATAPPPRVFGDFQWTERRGLSRKALAKACTFIEENIGENISLDDVARAACISRFHFSRLFRISTGESPMGYCLRLRIERAKELLARGGTKISEIAAALGFFDQSHLSRTFRRMTGMSPGEFARLHAESEQAA